ncbi:MULTISPECIES: SiaB family protein kinase [unclassified Lentimicrobium]|uniref:SiaB family protein kinase n=1 Tax=unclassified Lentimicrobium TaxID=2677434 RepID=UPI0015562E62|nr:MULTISPECIES: SiaB family protein kinase [unclassified Lentimicrobium]NPD44267.1 hypothetical protein [Lentimicrobium sp. S6]NPD86189.1 hypothetical protein [Lentimicrobium sp. L6]
MNTISLTTILRYHGEINGPIISELLDDLDFKCINLDVPDTKRKKIFNIAVEMFQNLYHYTRDLITEGIEEEVIRAVFLAFEMDEDYYYLKTQNLIISKDEEKLKHKIDKVNNMNNQEIRSYYRQVLNNEEFSDKGGAGLGFIDMKKRSGEYLSYEISKVNESLKKYTLIVKVKK